jgi:hypothetical protein
MNVTEKFKKNNIIIDTTDECGEDQWQQRPLCMERTKKP